MLQLEDPNCLQPTSELMDAVIVKLLIYSMWDHGLSASLSVTFAKARANISA